MGVLYGHPVCVSYMCSVWESCMSTLYVCPVCVPCNSSLCLHLDVCFRSIMLIYCTMYVSDPAC